MSKHKTLYFILFIIIIALFVAVGILIGAGLVRNTEGPTGASPYTAFYMSSGDVYFGKISWFPSPRLTDVWLLQKGTGANGQSQLGVLPLTSAFWGPVDSMNINMSQVLFWTHLRNDSQLVPALQDPSALFGTSTTNTYTP